MKPSTIRSRFRLLGAFILLLSSFVSAQAQSASVPAGAAQPNEAKPMAKSEGENGEVQQLKSKVEQLQLLIEQQQRALAEMQKRVDDLSSARAAPVVSTKPDGTTVVSSDLRTASLETSPAAKPAPAQNPAIIRRIRSWYAAPVCRLKAGWHVILISKSKVISPIPLARCCATFMSTS